MAEGKRSFLLYTDLVHTVKLLTDEQAGKLFKHVLAYVNDQGEEIDDQLLKLVFEPIKQSLKRDLQKYEKMKSDRRKAGKASAEKRAKRTRVEQVEQVSANPTVNDNVNVSDSVSVNDNVIEKRKEVFKKQVFELPQDQETKMEFFEYWSEHNDNGKKMRFEMSKNQPFNLNRRMGTWLKRQNQFAKEKSSAKKEKFDAADYIRQKNGIDFVDNR